MNDIHADQCYSTALVRCRQLVHPHEGDHIYGQPGQPMERLTPMADAAGGFTGTVIHPEVTGAVRVWSCQHRHQTVDGAKACAAHWSGRCARCEGVLEEVVDAAMHPPHRHTWRCKGNQILGPCGYSLDPEELTADVLPTLEGPLRELLEMWRTDRNHKGGLEVPGFVADMLEEVLDKHVGKAVE